MKFVRAVALLLMSSCINGLSEEGGAGCEEPDARSEREGPDMMPGRACMECHSEFGVAGTVFQTADSLCNSGGVAGATIEILDASGNVVQSLTSNSVGNFYSRRAVPTPYTVRMRTPSGETRSMTTQAASGNCASCHRLNGAAPGRISTAAP